MAIIFEGCDKTGKSTVIDALLEYTEKEYGRKWEYHYFTNPRKLNVPAFDYFADVYTKASHHSIFSRSHISNDVYGQIFNTEQDLTDEQFSSLDSLLEKLNPLIFILTDEPDKILTRWNNDEMFGSEFIPDILNGFNCYLEGEGRSYLKCHEASFPQLVNKNGITYEMQRLLEDHISDCGIGWANPSPLNYRMKFHYFPVESLGFYSRRCLCGNYGALGVKTFELGKNDSNQNCKRCKTMLEKKVRNEFHNRWK